MRIIFVKKMYSSFGRIKLPKSMKRSLKLPIILPAKRTTVNILVDGGMFKRGSFYFSSLFFRLLFCCVMKYNHFMVSQFGNVEHLMPLIFS